MKFKRLRNALIAAAAMMLAATGSGWAKQDPSLPPGCGPSGGVPKKCDPQAPEIDAASGASAIALVSGILLLMRERSRSRRSSRKDDRGE